MLNNGYFDWAATAVPYPEALEKYIDVTAKFYANTSSIHSKGRKSKTILDASRKECSHLLNCNEKDIYFTSGGTESNNIIFSSMINRKSRGTILVSSIEHASILKPALALKDHGYEVKILECDNNGYITPEILAANLNSEIRLVSIMMINNETGVIQDIKKLSTIVKEYSKMIQKPIQFHCDAVQAVGKIPVNFSNLDITSAAISGHKFGGPKGTGILYLNKDINSIYKGGGQENNIRSGTENLAGIVATTLALRLSIQSLPSANIIAKSIKTLMIESFSEIKGIEIISKNDSNHSNYILNCSVPKIPSEVLLRMLDDKGFYVSNGSACSSNSAKKENYVLKAMKYDKNIIDSSIRISWGYATTLDETKKLIKCFEEIIQANKFLLQ